MARILGLDLGSYSVKAVLLETSMRSAAVKGYGEVPLKNGDVKGARTELFSKNAFNADQIVVSMPGLACWRRKSPSRCCVLGPQAHRVDVLAFEVEDELPFDLSEAVYDYHVASHDTAGSQLLVGVVKKDELGKVLEPLKELKLEPRIITHPGLAMHALMLQQAPNEAAVAIVDIGHDRTVVSVGRAGQGRRVSSRARSPAAASTSRAPSGRSSRSPPRKPRCGRTSTPRWARTPSATTPSGSSNAFIRGLLLERCASSSRRSSRTQARTRRNVDTVYLCGGTAKMPGLCEQPRSGPGHRPCAAARAAERGEERAGRAGSAGDAGVRAGAARQRIGRAVVQRFNLRRGDFAFKSDLDFVSDKLGQLVTFGAVLLVLLIASSIVRNTVLEAARESGRRAAVRRHAALHRLVREELRHRHQHAAGQREPGRRNTIPLRHKSASSTCSPSSTAAAAARTCR